MTEIILELIVSVGTTVALINIGLGIFLRSYITQKARNFATREDIQEITSKVESIKADIEFANQYKSHHKNREYETLQQILTDCIALRHAVFALANFPNYDFFSKSMERLQVLRLDLDKNIVVSRVCIKGETELSKCIEKISGEVENYFSNEIGGTHLQEYSSSLFNHDFWSKRYSTMLNQSESNGEHLANLNKNLNGMSNTVLSKRQMFLPATEKFLGLMKTHIEEYTPLLNTYYRKNYDSQN